MSSFEMPKDVLKFIKDDSVEIVDLRFTDFLGRWQHFSIPSGTLDDDVFGKGLGFDGSSIRGWQAIDQSDMLIKPVPGSAFVDPFLSARTLVLICDIWDPITGQRYSRDPRYVASKAEGYLKDQKLADIACYGPEAEFFIFDDVRFDQNEHEGYYHVNSAEGCWNSGRQENPNLGYKPRYKEGYFPVPPTDSQQDMRSEMLLNLERIGVALEAQHHEVATAGQAEIDMRFGPLLEIADGLMKYKYIVRNTAHRHNKTATFMPKPIFADNGSGMHVHISLWRDGQNLFAGDRYAGLSEMALYAIGGLLKHAPSLLAFTDPTTNSFKRLVPGFEAPVNLVYSQRNRSAAIRIPMYSSSAAARRLEFRCPDPTCNPYLAFSAMLMAALDGIQNKIHPGEPLDKDIYELPPEEQKGIPQTPAYLHQALDALKGDHEYLLRGDVFTPDVIEMWISYKMANEVKAIDLRPHPWEFTLYYDI
jgi:glutamine synthetase